MAKVDCLPRAERISKDFSEEFLRSVFKKSVTVDSSEIRMVGSYVA